MLTDLKLKILKYILKERKKFSQDQQIYHIIIGKLDNVFQMILLILKLMQILDNKDYFLEIKEIEKYINIIYIQVINVDPNKKPEDGMTRTEIDSPEAI